MECIFLTQQIDYQTPRRQDKRRSIRGPQEAQCSEESEQAVTSALRKELLLGEEPLSEGWDLKLLHCHPMRAEEAGKAQERTTKTFEKGEVKEKATAFDLRAIT